MAVAHPLARSAQSRQCRKPRLMPRPSGQKGSCSASPTRVIITGASPESLTATPLWRPASLADGSKATALFDCLRSEKSKSCSWLGTCMGGQMNGWIERCTYTWTDREGLMTDGRTDRRTDRQTASQVGIDRQEATPHQLVPVELRHELGDGEARVALELGEVEVRARTQLAVFGGGREEGTILQHRAGLHRRSK